MDHSALAAELIRARRGKRTQRALSRVLGYRSNVVFAWENGHDEPNARTFFRLVQKTGDGTLPGSYPGQVGCTPDLTSKSGIASYLQGLGKDWKVSELSRALGRDRYAISRFMKGQTDIKLGDLLHFVDVTTDSIFEFLALFADPAKLPSARESHQQTLLARRRAREMPWAPALVAMTDLRDYQCLVAHVPGWFAARLGISLEEEERCLEQLSQSGQLEQCGGLYRRVRGSSLVAPTDHESRAHIASFWLQLASERVHRPSGASSAAHTLAAHTLAVSRKKWEAIRAHQEESLLKLQSILGEGEDSRSSEPPDENEPTEVVAVLSWALLELEATASS